MNEARSRNNLDLVFENARDSDADEGPTPAEDQRPIARIRVVWRDRIFLTRAAVAGLIVSVLVAFLIPNQYDATARLMPPDERGPSGLSLLASIAGQSGALGALAGDALGMKSSGALFVGILGSRTIQDQLVVRFDLKKVYGVKFSEDARKRLESLTVVSEDRKSGIITITATDRDPARAAGLAGAYIEELERVVSQLSTSSAHRERVFLEGRLNDVKHDLDDAAQKLGQFASKNTTIDISTQGKAMVDAAAQLQGQMIAAQSQLQGLLQIYTEDNVRVRESKARIAELGRQLERLSGARGSSPNGAADDDPLYPSIKQLPLLGITYADLYRRTKIEEVVYETLTQQYELAKVQEVKETPSVKILDLAEVPKRKSFPPRTIIIFVGFTLSILVGAASILGKDWWLKTDPCSPGKAFTLEVVSVVRQHLVKKFVRKNAGL